MSYVKHRPDTCGKRPFAAGICETPFSSIVFSSAPLTSSVTTKFPNGSTASTWPRVIGNGGGVYAGQKSPLMSGARARQVGPQPARVRDREVDADRRTSRIASVDDVPDERLAQCGRPRGRTGQPAGWNFVELPITVLKIGASCALSWSMRAWIAGSGVTPIVHGRWKLAVL